jgi:ATP-dependent DNA ligase
MSKTSDCKKYSVRSLENWSFEMLSDLRNHFLKVLSSGGEGLIIKPSNSIYKPGKRKSWIKVII